LLRPPVVSPPLDGHVTDAYMPPKGANGQIPVFWVSEQSVDLSVDVFLGAFDPVLPFDRAGEKHGSSEVSLGDFAVVLTEAGDTQGVVGVVAVPQEVVGPIVDDP